MPSAGWAGRGTCWIPTIGISGDCAGIGWEIEEEDITCTRRAGGRLADPTLCSPFTLCTPLTRGLHTHCQGALQAGDVIGCGWSGSWHWLRVALPGCVWLLMLGVGRMEMLWILFLSLLPGRSRGQGAYGKGGTGGHRRHLKIWGEGGWS